MKQPKNITIIGLGLIGGSLGLALKKKIPNLVVRGIDHHPESVRTAVRLGAVDTGSVRLEEGIIGAEVIFIATPVSEMGELVAQLCPYLSAGMIVTDMGSTKAQIVAEMERRLPQGVAFLGGHPLAGSEKAGIKEAHAELLENAVYLLTPTTRTTVETVEAVSGLLEQLGAKIMLLSPVEHDRKVAAISHLPHVLSSALVRTVGRLDEKEGGYFPLAAGGFRDTTRIAGSQSGMWCDILRQNRQAVLPLLGEFRQVLAEYEAAIAAEDGAHLVELLERSRCWREKVPAGLKGILPQFFELTVTVPDQPGVLAELTAALQEKSINISDIEIRPVRDEQAGTLRLAFGSKEARDLAAQVLTAKGYPVGKAD